MPYVSGEQHILNKLRYWENRLAAYRARYSDSEDSEADFRRQDNRRQREYHSRYKSYSNRYKRSLEY